MRRKIVQTTVGVGAGLVLALTGSSVALARIATDFEQCATDKGAVGSDKGHGDKGSLEVCKTVKVEKTRAWSWTLTKTASPTATTLVQGAAGQITYTITATPTLVETETVSGTIVVRNSTGEPLADVRVEDVIDLPGSPPSTVVIDPGVDLAPGEEHAFPYSIAIPATSPKGDSTNTARVVWDKRQGSAVVHFDAAQADNILTYNRTPELSDAFGPVPAGLSLGAPSDAGPWEISAGDPASLTHTFTAPVTNVSLTGGASAKISNTAHLTSPGIPEIVGDAKESVPSIPLDVSAAADVTVTAPGGPGTFVVTPPSTVPVLGGGVCARVTLTGAVVPPRHAQGGGIVVFVTTVRNTSRNAARGVLFRQTLPAGFSLLPATGQTLRGGQLRVALGTLGAGRTATVRMRVRIARPVAGSRSTTASVSAKCGRTVTARGSVLVAAVRPARVQPAVTG